MSTLEERFIKAEEKIFSHSFRQNKGFEEALYIFDYDPHQELYVRERIDFIIKKSQSMDFTIKLFDLYDIVNHITIDKGFLKKNFSFESKRGLSYVNAAMNNMLRIKTPKNLVVKYLEENSDGCDAIFITGIGKVYPLFRAHYLLNSLQSITNSTPVITFYPGSYDGMYLTLFSEIKDDNHYRAFKLID